jgi:sugar phosphate isomerase/epimerase
MIGIIQGRLTNFNNKKILQKFPKNYKSEFETASKLGFDFIEIFVERKFNYNNPFWSKKGINQYNKLIKKFNLKFISITDDRPINLSILTKKYLTYFRKLVRLSKKLKIEKINIPLYEKSKINKKNLKAMSYSLSVMAKECKNYNIKMLIESNISFEIYKKIKKHKNIFFLYDTGNRSVLKTDPEKDIIMFGKNIKHIHIKDKSANGQNVLLGMGVVNFNKIFKGLKKISYKEDYVFETTRGKDAMCTAKSNISFLNRIMQK